VKSSRLSESFSASRTGYLVHRVLRGVAFARPRGLPTHAFPVRLHGRFILSQAWTSYRDLRGCCHRPGVATGKPALFHVSGSSHEVSRPFSDITGRVGSLPRFHPKRLPPRPFAGPRGLDPQPASQPCFMLLPLLGFESLLRAFPHRTTPPTSSVSGSLSAFGPHIRRWRVRPQGLPSCGDPFRAGSISSDARSMPSRAFRSSPRCSCVLVWSHGASRRQSPYDRSQGLIRS